MEPSEPRSESEVLEPGPDENPSVEVPGPDMGPEDEEKKEVTCWGSHQCMGGGPQGAWGSQSGQDRWGLQGGILVTRKCRGDMGGVWGGLFEAWAGCRIWQVLLHRTFAEGGSVSSLTLLTTCLLVPCGL